MKLYNCSHCGNALYFENSLCLKCQHNIGFDSNKLSLITLYTENSVDFSDITQNEIVYRYCQNAMHGTCNWLIPADQSSNFCLACSLNRTIPTLSNPENIQRWRQIEMAKHRLVYSLLRLILPIQSKDENEETGLAFDFMADTPTEENVMTGHKDGIITLNIEEADEAERTQNKLNMGEKYRTLLGHFRHEIAHYYWDLLIKNSYWLDKFRMLYGDERQDYAAALKIYYASTLPSHWNEYFISPYASSHPWEDWAETWAHYLHLMDTLETAHAFGIDINPKQVNNQNEIKAEIYQDPYSVADFDQIIRMWLPLTFAVNSLNRSMGHEDFYPFVIAPNVVEKLRFIHEVCGAGRWN